MTLPLDPVLEARARRYGERLLGLFFRAWAHELNNPVQAVLAGAELIDMELDVAGATVESLRTQVGNQARELAVEVVRISDGIARLHTLSRPVCEVLGRCGGELVLAEAIALWRPVAQHLGLRTHAPEATNSAPELPVPLEVGCLLVLGALAAIGRAEPVPKAIELSWSMDREGAALILGHGGVTPRALDPETWEALLQLTGAELHPRPEALELRFAAP